MLASYVQFMSFLLMTGLATRIVCGPLVGDDQHRIPLTDLREVT